MKRLFLTALSMLCLSLTMQTYAQKKVHTIGDSTMDSYAGGGTNKMGWGGVLQQFFNGKDATDKGITVKNMAKSGSSSRTFYTDSRLWPTMKTGAANAMKAGDILIIQFAHNDENNKGVDALELKAYNEAHGGAAVTDLRGTTPTTTYKANLRTLIDEAKAMGVKPILVGAICRNYFNGTTIKKSGLHNLADGYSKLTANGVQENQKLNPDDHTMDYTYQMGEVAKEYDDVPFINFTEGTKQLFEGLGATYCAENIFNVGDGTHTGMMGATLVARHFAKTLLEAISNENNDKKKAVLQELAQYVSLTSDIALTPSSADMGKIYVASSVSKTFSIAGFDLTPAKGTATVSTTDGYLVSLDNEAFASSVSINVDGGNAFATVYVKGTPMAEGIQTGKLTITYGDIVRSADLSIEGIINTTGTESTLTFPLNASNQAVIVGDIMAGSEVIEGMVVGNPATASINGIDYRRYKVEGTWPNNIDEVSTRYIEFSAVVPEGKTFRLDRISLDYAASATNNMNCKIYYSTAADFSNAKLIKEHHSLPSGVANTVSVMPMTELTSGDKIYVRVYPWIDADGQSGKYICLSNLVFHGYAEDIPQYIEASTTWDFSEFTSQVLLSKDLDYSGSPKYAMEYTKDDLTLLLVGTETGQNSSGSDAEYVNKSYGFHCNGASSASTRYIKFTPQYSGKLTVSYRSNNSSAKDRIVAIGTAVKTFNPIPDVLDDVVLAAGLTDGSVVKTISADLTAGNTYYAYFAAGGSSITNLQYDYRKPTTSIDNIVRPRPVTSNIMYNINGQRVSSSHKGIVIVNGKKYANF